MSKRNKRMNRGNIKYDKCIKLIYSSTVTQKNALYYTSFDMRLSIQL